MKILIFGAGGFIGSNLIEHLIEQGVHEVTGVDITDVKLAGIEGPNFKFIEGNISNYEMTDKLVANTDVVVDLIAYANPSIYVESPLEVVNLNFFENMKILEHCLHHQKRLVQYSTSEVYGKRSQDDRYSDDTSDLIMGPVQKQRWIYASSKQLLERIIYAHGIKGDLNYSIIRPFNFVGPTVRLSRACRVQGWSTGVLPLHVGDVYRWTNPPCRWRWPASLFHPHQGCV